MLVLHSTPSETYQNTKTQRSGDSIKVNVQTCEHERYQWGLVNNQGIIIKTNLTCSDIMIAANNSTLTVFNHFF